MPTPRRISRTGHKSIKRLLIRPMLKNFRFPSTTIRSSLRCVHHVIWRRSSRPMCSRLLVWAVHAGQVGCIPAKWPVWGTDQQGQYHFRRARKPQGHVSTCLPQSVSLHDQAHCATEWKNASKSWAVFVNWMSSIAMILRSRSRQRKLFKMNWPLHFNKNMINSWRTLESLIRISRRPVLTTRSYSLALVWDSVVFVCFFWFIYDVFPCVNA